ncbi:MAG: asparagine synthase (glutamine-hydrolyzing) [Oscillospiraceae bacterium]|nr:asparagine synthase (glutamine-hydrolyzing) [Oscillospiraceae bacterium]
MCAIAGVVGQKLSDLVIEKMLHTMKRRGPDDQGCYETEDCTLLHTRLAVIDPAGGKQPMTVKTGQKTYTICYNGELYNTEEIREELKKLGHEFAGHSDTEAALHAFIQWKEGCLDRFNGIFAFAVWEEQEKKLFIARDRMGVKPLFYAEHEGNFLFASEIKTILTYPGFKARLDAQGAAEILLLGPGRTPGCGVFQGIQELPGGFCGYRLGNKLSIKQYWKLTDREHTDSFEDTAQMVRYLVTDSIKRQMVSDVPIGTFLSGGLDSSIISAVCAWEMKNKGSQLMTFSVDYEHNDKYFTPNKFQPNSDGYFIRLMQQTLQSDQHDCLLCAEELFSSLGEAVIARDLPGMAGVDISLLAFCKRIRKDVKVALSGECADEIFGGYPWYRDPEIRDKEGFPWAQNTRQRCSMLSKALRGKVNAEAYIHQRYEDTCRNSDILPGVSKQERRMKEMVNLNQQWFMQTLLDRKDRMSMYSGLEVRVPFCDYRIAEYLYGVPWEYKDYKGKEKGLLRHAMEGLLPQEVLWRKKSPYPKTFDPAYLEMVTAQLHSLLNDPGARLFDLVDKEQTRVLLETEYAWPWYGQLMKLPQTICYLLQTEFWLREYDVELVF